MKYAIVESGGKQFKAVEGATIEVDHLLVEKGKQIDLETVLLLADGEKITIGTPTIKGAKVKATVVGDIPGPKLVTFKYSPKKRIRKKTGHRQQYTQLKVDSIKVE